MAHPFEKIFYKKLKQSSVEDNLVLKEALKIKEKGYRPEEIAGVLQNLQKSLIDDIEAEIVTDALEEFELFLASS